MRWQKQGLILPTENLSDWWFSHALAPTSLQLESGLLRVFVGARDKRGVSRITSVDVELGTPIKVVRVSDKPALDIGRPGTFDDNGVMPASVFEVGSILYLFYTGFQMGVNVEYYMFGGVAISYDRGLSFTRVSETPMLDRSPEGLFSRSGAAVHGTPGNFRVWYSAGSRWVTCGEKLRPAYDIFFTHTHSLSSAPPEGEIVLQANHSSEHALGRPQVYFQDGLFNMYFTRRTLDFKYSFGFATSPDGMTWERSDDIGIKFGEPGAFDSDMLYFPTVAHTCRETYLFYNGNNFGAAGLAAAKLEK